MLITKQQVSITYLFLKTEKTQKISQSLDWTGTCFPSRQIYESPRKSSVFIPGTHLPNHHHVV